MKPTRSQSLCNLKRRIPLVLIKGNIGILEIHGNPQISYGIDDPNKPNYQKADCIEDVCNQVIFHQKRIFEQQKKIVPDKFWIISYEDFCKDPAKLVKRVSEDILKTSIHDENKLKTLKPFEIANRVKIDSKIFKEIKHKCGELEMI